MVVARFIYGGMTVASKIKVIYEKLFWECECCGDGFDTRLTAGEKVYSHDDQFGGPLNSDDIDLGHDPDESVYGILAELAAEGVEYEYEEKFDPYEPTDWSEFDSE